MKVVWLLEELGLPYQRIDAGGPFGRTADPGYRAMNPTGGIPTLQEEAFSMWESNAILRYLCAANAPDHSFWPADLRQRANIDRWMDWQQTSLNRPQTIVFQGLIRTPPEQRNMGAIEAAADAGRAWSLLDAELARHAYVAGPGLTLADMALGVHVHRWFSFMVTRPETPHLKAWYGRLLARPVFHEHCAAPLT